jgi:hypothetical protein
LLALKVTPAFQLEPDADMAIGPTPEMTTTTLDGAHPPLSRYVTVKAKVVDGVPVPGETVPFESAGACEAPLQLAAPAGAGPASRIVSASMTAAMAAPSHRPEVDRSVVVDMLRRDTPDGRSVSTVAAALGAANGPKVPPF